jgi:hypothetical protein
MLLISDCCSCCISNQDGNSKQTKMPYFESGWVDPEDLKKEEARKAGKGGFKFPWD